jgi:hypothetical protein
MKNAASCSLALLAAVTMVQAAAAADMPMKAAPPAAIAPGGFFASLTGSYFFADPNHDIFISPNNGGAGGANCCGSGLGDGWGTRGTVGYRWSNWDVAIGLEYARLTQGGLNPSYAGSALMHAPDGHYWVLDGEVGYNFTLGTTKARVFVGPRYARWTMHDEDQQTLPQFTFDVDTKGIGPRLGVALSGPFGGNFGWMAEGSVAWLYGDMTGTTGGLAAVASVTNHPTIFNAELRGGVDYWFAPMTKLTVGYQANVWTGALPEFEYDGFGNPLAGGHASTINHGPFARLSYGFM